MPVMILRAQATETNSGCLKGKETEELPRIHRKAGELGLEVQEAEKNFLMLLRRISQLPLLTLLQSPGKGSDWKHLGCLSKLWPPWHRESKNGG